MFSSGYRESINSSNYKVIITRRDLDFDVTPFLEKHKKHRLTSYLIFRNQLNEIENIFQEFTIVVSSFPRLLKFEYDTNF